MKVIFLDIDGVLISRAYDRKRTWNEHMHIDETRLPIIKKIVDGMGEKIVLSSTWSEHWGKDVALFDGDGVNINETFAKFGLEIYDKTPARGIEFDRSDEINSWLETRQETIESFIIVDYYRYAWGKLSDRFVKKNPHFGLGLVEAHGQMAIKILNG